MTVLAISAGLTVLAWIGLALGVVVLIVVVALFNGLMRPLLEIHRYVRDILDGGVGIARGVDGADELARTQQLAGAVPDLAGAYLDRVRRGE